MRESLNSYLSACLVMVGIRALIISCNVPILSLRRPSLGGYETILRLSRKPTHHVIAQNLSLEYELPNMHVYIFASIHIHPYTHATS